MANKFDPQRMRQMELLLRWEGQLGNARLREVLGLTSIRASQWIRELRDANPRWTVWNSQTKSFDATKMFYNNTKAHVDSLTDYLGIVGLPSAMEPIGGVVVAAFPDLTPPDPLIFATLTSAARSKRMVEVTYRSMKEPAPHQRIIAPHSVVHAGRRWHVRAYCEKNKQFRDYALGRIELVNLLDRPAQFAIEDDKDWMTEVPVRLVAHPDLTYEQSVVIGVECFNGTSARTTNIRAPLINYYIQDVRAATDVNTQRPPEFQLAVSNLKELKKWLF